MGESQIAPILWTAAVISKEKTARGERRRHLHEPSCLPGISQLGVPELLRSCRSGSGTSCTRRRFAGTGRRAAVTMLRQSQHGDRDPPRTGLRMRDLARGGKRVMDIKHVAFDRRPFGKDIASAKLYAAAGTLEFKTRLAHLIEMCSIGVRRDTRRRGEPPSWPLQTEDDDRRGAAPPSQISTPSPSTCENVERVKSVSRASRWSVVDHHPCLRDSPRRRGTVA